MQVLKHNFIISCAGKRYENPNEEKQLVQWENIIADNYLTKMEAREADSVESRVRTVVER